MRRWYPGSKITSKSLYTGSSGLIGRTTVVQLRFVLRAQFDAVLLGERLRELGAGEKAAGDEDLAEASPVFALCRERTLELRLGQELQVDEHLAERTPCLLRL